jgi:uncharacterized damage-inducible protein DinB
MLGTMARGAQNGGVPYFARPVADERDALLTFLALQRTAVRAAAYGLTDEQARRRPAASTLSLGGLVKHVARTERRWVVAGIAGQPLPGLWPIQDWPADFQLTGEETLAGLLDYYNETAELTSRIVAAISDLGQPSAVSHEQSARWVLFHLIQETARHAGHADIIREELDGKRVADLLDAYEAGATGPVA